MGPFYNTTVLTLTTKCHYKKIWRGYLSTGEIYLYVSHCENTILEGEIPNTDLIQKVYTTDSIFTGCHEKITVWNV